MKRVLSAVAALVLLAGPVSAQNAAPASAAAEEAKAAMAKLAFLDGWWEGEGWTTEAGGQRLTFRQTERVGPLLDGGVKLVEGRGQGVDGKGAFNAFGVLSPAREPDTYEFRAYTQGRAATFKARLLEPGKLVWEIPAGPNRIAYTMTVADGVWTEVGDFIAPGAEPRRFFEMTVRRKGDASWLAPETPPAD